MFSGGSTLCVWPQRRVYFQGKILFCPCEMVTGRMACFVVRLPSRRRARFFRFFVLVEVLGRTGSAASPRRLKSATPVAVRACPESSNITYLTKKTENICKKMAPPRARKCDRGRKNASPRAPAEPGAGSDG